MVDQLLVGRLGQGLRRIHELLENLSVVLELGFGAREHVGQVALDVARGAATSRRLQSNTIVHLPLFIISFFQLFIIICGLNG